MIFAQTLPAATQPGATCTLFLLHWDVGVAVVLLVIHVLGWLSSEQRKAQDATTDYSTAATNVSAATSSNITAVSILFSAAMLLGFQASSITKIAIDSVIWATVWFLISLIISVFVALQIPVNAHACNVARKGSMGGLLGVQFIFLIVGVCRLVEALINR